MKKQQIDDLICKSDCLEMLLSGVISLAIGSFLAKRIGNKEDSKKDVVDVSRDV